MSDSNLGVRRAPPIILQRLRSVTRDDHRALDHHPELQRLLYPALTWDGYRRSLLAMHAPQAALEAALYESAQALGTTAQLSPLRLPCLEADLAELGVMSPVPARVPGVRVPGTRAEWLGLRYVLEGSRLGSEVIARCVRNTLGEEAPLRFFAAPHAQKYWQDFMAQLSHEPFNPIEQRQIVTSAKRAFAAYLTGLRLNSGLRFRSSS